MKKFVFVETYLTFLFVVCFGSEIVKEYKPHVIGMYVFAD